MEPELGGNNWLSIFAEEGLVAFVVKLSFLSVEGRRPVHITVWERGGGGGVQETNFVLLN